MLQLWCHTLTVFIIKLHVTFRATRCAPLPCSFGVNFYPTVFILIFTLLVLSLNKLWFYLIRRHVCVSLFRCVFYSISSSTLFYPYIHCCRLLFNLLLFCLFFYVRTYDESKCLWYDQTLACWKDCQFCVLTFSI